MSGVQIPEFEAGRLRYRAPRRSDFEAYHAFCASDRAVGVGGPYPHRGQAFIRLSAVIGHWALRGYGRWMIADRETDAPLGVVGLFYPEDWPEPEIAWSLFGDAEGRGIAFEAALFSRAYAYETLGWQTAISCVAPSNTRSIALAERMGATFEGIQDNPELGPLHVWRHPSPEEL
ncbi:MAG: GNAT family N-acetyltransferase [Pseudomonadota bacterium]